MSSLLNKLGDLLNEEYKLQKGVREQVQSLSRELEVMHAALRKVAEVPREQLDPLVKLWARDVRELSYDLEDIVDTVPVEDGCEATSNPHWLRNLMEKMGNWFSKGKACHQIANMIKDIKDQVQEVANRHGRYTVDSIVAKPAATSTIDPRLLAMYKDVAQLVGIDGPRDALIKMLSEGDDASNNKKMKIVSVVGFGGLGKTTLAKAVYDNLKARFDCCAFVPVGQNPDMKKVLRDIWIDLEKENYKKLLEKQNTNLDVMMLDERQLFNQLQELLDKQKHTNLDVMTLDERQLINQLQEFLGNKRYFIIIDDIWDKKSWEIIRCALADSNCGSRVVATTRIFEVATNAGDVYKLLPLSRDNSEKLFNTRIVDCKGKCLHNQSTEVYDKILKKCGGLPLVIITIASLLASKPGEDWSEVYNSIGFGHGDNVDVENTRKILSFSYYDLPSHLRTCLLYLSVFPEDYWIDKYILIWKWIAEGFILDEQGIGLFEVGERYFNELINRSMIKPDEFQDTGYILGCRVHDMVLDLVRSLSSEENLVTILDNEQQTFQHSNARRLALQNRIKEHNPLANVRVQHVRSFTAILCDIGMISPSFRVLRVLSMEKCSFMEGYNSLKHLGNLFNLRYLGLTNTPIRKLPKEIGDLKFLQTLNLGGTGIEELPQTVGLLTQLVCLYADEKTRVPDWIGNLTSLQQLWIGRAVDSDRSARFVKELGNLRELRVLRAKIDVRDENLERDLMESLGNLHKIQFVGIGGQALGKGGCTWETWPVSPRRLNFLLLECLEFSRLPMWINSSLLPNLCLLEVNVQVVQEQDMETIGRLPQLCCLRLWLRYTPAVSIIGGDGQLFHKLRFFKTNTPIRFVHGECSMAPIMPSLEALRFDVNVRFLKDANLGFDMLGLENLPSLQRVTAKIICQYACAAEVEEAEAALRHAAAVHPNRPTLQTTRLDEDRMLSSDQDQEATRFSRKVVYWDVNVRKQKDEEHYFNFHRLLRNPRVEKVSVCINCEDASVGEVEEVEAALRHVVDIHPNHPTLEIMMLPASYYDLPAHLRTCLLSLSVFPKDYWINKNLLIWKWIAEGFVHDEQGIGLLEVGEIYFNELINRSMIKPGELADTGYVTSCRVHAMVLDLVRSLSSKENFVTILDNEQQTFSQSNAPRLALQNIIEGHNPLANMGVQHVRSFTAIKCDIGMISPSFRVLRVLAIESCGFMEGYNSLEHLGNLLHLRYLGLTHTPIRGLPKEIGDLKFLQTLELTGTGIEELPSSVGLLTQLVCLRADDKTRVPDWIGNLTSLQELWIWPAVDSSARFVKELDNLRELRELETKIDVREESLERALVESLRNLHKIQFVHIGGVALGKGGCMWEAGPASPRLLRHLSLGCLEFSRLPGWINSSLLPNLCFLCVNVQVVQEQDMETLGRLPQLCSLQLWSRYTPALSIIGGDGQLFHKLRFLMMQTSIRFVHGECSIAPIMPSLEALEFDVDVRFLKDANLGFDKFGLENLLSLHRVTASIYCQYAHAAEVEEAEAALRHVTAVHPNRPTLQTTRLDEDLMLSSDQEQEHTRWSLKVIGWVVDVREKKDKDHYFNFLELLWYPRVEKLSVGINCEDASVGEVEEEKAALSHAVDVHPNHPTLEITMLPATTRSCKVVDLDVNVRKDKDDMHYFDFLGLLWYPRVKKVSVHINCEDARVGEVEEAKAALSHAVDVHPNHPTLEIMMLPASYYDLPSHLRTCLLHLSVFPKDYGIDKNLLISKWIAEGFLHDEQGIGLLEVGERYFNELINRNMIKPYEEPNTGYVIGCRVHYMVFDLIRSLSSEENFVTILDSEQQTFSHSNALRLAFHRIKEHNPPGNMGVQHVRSFTAICSDIGMTTPSFQVLHVLDIQHCGFLEGYNSLEHLGNLLHLRYLGLTHTPIRGLPKEIGGLKFLQTLELTGTGIEEFPSSVGLLTQLVCLCADEKTRVPDWIGNLTSLQELRIWPAVDSSARFVKELGNLRELRELKTKIDVRDESLEKALVESLGNLHKIQFVSIGGEALGKGATWEAWPVSPRHLDYLSLACLEFSRLPAWINSSLLPNLCFLQVKVQVVQEQDMETLGRLLQLRSLRLHSRCTVAVSIIGGDGQLFHKLRFFITDISVRFVHGECSMAPIMPSLESLQFDVYVRFMKDANIGFDKLGLGSLPSIQNVTAQIDCRDARAAEVEEAEAALRHAAAVHPNRPTLETTRLAEDEMLSTDQDQDQEATRFSRKVVDLGVKVRKQKDEEHYFNFLELLWNPCVEKVSVCINCEDASVGEMEEAEAALRHAVDIHPNHPTLEIMMLPASYYDLPSHLRTCLLYLSVFPEDDWINKDLLIWKWIAEGFVHDEQGIGLLEVGERYFNELININMIKPDEDPLTGYVRGCRVHHMVLDLARSLSKKEDFVTILDNEQQIFSQSNAPRLAFHRIKEHNPPANMSVQHVRSFTAIWCDIGMISPNFQVLHVLAIENCGFMEGYNNLEHLGNLLHLRYLGLTDTPIHGLPKEIGDQKFLQTLELRGTGIEELPPSVGLLTQLVCLRADEKTRVPDWIGNLTSLQELWIWPAVDSSARFVKELGNLRELRELITTIDVREESLERDLVESLSNLHKIQYLEILGKPFGKGATWEAGTVSPRLRFLFLPCLDFSRLPVWINSSLLPNLSSLHVEVQVVQEQDMETLGRLLQLRSLRLYSRCTVAVSIIGGDGQLFHKLRFFITDISVRFVHGKGSMAPIMPSLEALEFCVLVRFLKDANLGFDKLGLENLPSLQKVTASIDCQYGRAAEVEEAEAALRHAAAVHPNRPTLQTTRLAEDEMLSSGQDQEATKWSRKVVDYDVNVREEKDEEHYFNFLKLLWNPCVEKLSVCINCKDASVGEVEEAEAALRHAVDVHPNHPALEITRDGEDKMMLSDRHQQQQEELRTEGDEHSSDFESAENGDGTEDDETEEDEDADEGEDSVKAQSSSKRKRSGDDEDDDDGDDEGRPSKR